MEEVVGYKSNKCGICKPCCCIPLRKGCLILAVVDTLLSLGNLVSHVVFLLRITVSRRQYRLDNPEVTDGDLLVGTISTGFQVLFATLGFSLSVQLYVGVKKRKFKILKKFVIVRTIVYTIAVITLAINGGFGTTETYIWVAELAVIFYRVYLLICVYNLYHEFIKTENKDTPEDLGKKGKPSVVVTSVKRVSPTDGEEPLPIPHCTVPNLPSQ